MGKPAPEFMLGHKVEPLPIRKVKIRDGFWGYLNTYFTIKEPQMRWKNLRDNHELYCAGHMIEAAVAYYEATGKRKLLDAVCHLADHIDSCWIFSLGGHLPTGKLALSGTAAQEHDNRFWDVKRVTMRQLIPLTAPVGIMYNCEGSRERYRNIRAYGED
jgi:hypothetical protein